MDREFNIGPGAEAEKSIREISGLTEIFFKVDSAVKSAVRQAGEKEKAKAMIYRAVEICFMEKDEVINNMMNVLSKAKEAPNDNKMPKAKADKDEGGLTDRKRKEIAEKIMQWLDSADCETCLYYSDEKVCDTCRRRTKWAIDHETALDIVKEVEDAIRKEQTDDTCRNQSRQ